MVGSNWCIAIGIYVCGVRLIMGNSEVFISKTQFNVPVLANRARDNEVYCVNLHIQGAFCYLGMLPGREIDRHGYKYLLLFTSPSELSVSVVSTPRLFRAPSYR